MNGMGRGYSKLLRFDGVRLCHKNDMSHDFGCFSPKEEPEG